MYKSLGFAEGDSDYELSWEKILPTLESIDFE